MIREKIDGQFMYYLDQGLLHDAYKVFGAHLHKDSNGAILGCEFCVLAPNATKVSVVGEFNSYNPDKNMMERIDEKGIYYTYIEGNLEWARYKYRIETPNKGVLLKADPYAYFADLRPLNDSKVYDIEGYEWHDSEWFASKKKVYEQPLCVYEVHLGSWRRKDGQFMKYNEIAPQLIQYMHEQGYTHVEFLPVYEHPLDDSWGYMGTGYYAATARFGVPKDFMYLVDEMHKNGFGVIMDWVPGHICRDAFGLYMFDGEALYDYSDPKIRDNEVWGTANLDLGKGYTKSFLLSNALFWLKYFHVDGFRVDAVSNIIYYLGNPANGVNEGACNFLRDLSRTLFAYDDRVLLMAEDSSAHDGVTRPVDMGGLGFNYKWNMGWMNDTLRYFKLDPIYRRYHHNLITFGLVYAFSEQFILPLSHDEVVHLKASLLNKMPGDYWQKFANYRLLMGLMMVHPGKKLLFMGGEFAHYKEWDFKSELDWNLYKYPAHDSANRFVRDMIATYRREPALFSSDHKKEGFEWIESNNSYQSIFIFARYSENFDDHVVVVLNATPVVYHDYSIGVPGNRDYVEIMNSDYDIYGGSGQYNGAPLKLIKESLHGQPNHINITVPPLGIAVFKMKPKAVQKPKTVSTEPKVRKPRVKKEVKEK